MASKTIEQVLQEHTPDLMLIPDVVGTGQGLCNGKPCIKVLVSSMSRQIKQKVPNRIEGYKVKVEVTGPFRAL